MVNNSTKGREGLPRRPLHKPEQRKTGADFGGEGLDPDVTDCSNGRRPESISACA
jgi:hypothetical protein